MSSGDSHTGFDSAGFTMGAVGGAALLGSAFVATLQAIVQANREACDRWDRKQLEEAFNCSEILRAMTVDRAEKAERELRQMKSLLRKRGSRG